MSHDDHKACYVTYLGEQVRAMSPDDLAALRAHRQAEASVGAHLLQETGTDPVAVPAEVVVGFLAYLEQAHQMTGLTQLIYPQLTQYLSTIVNMLVYYLVTSVDQAALVRDCLSHHDHAGEGGASSSSAHAAPVDATDLLSSLGFNPYEISRLNKMAADKRH